MRFPKPSFRWTSSPILFLLLGSATLLLAFRWIDATRAPSLPQWNWEQHPNVVMIVYNPGGCACGPGIHDLVAQSISYHAGVLILANLSAEDRDVLAKDLARFPFHLITGVHPSVLKKWSPTGNTTLYRISRGRIVNHAARSIPPNFFGQS